MHSGMLERAEVNLIGDHRDVEDGRGKQFARENSGLMNVQAAGTRENHCRAGIDGDGCAAFAIEVSQAAGERVENVLDPARVVLPGVCSRVLQVEHDAGSAGVQHLHHELGFIGGTSHLIPLVSAPFGKLDPPGSCCGRGRRRIDREFAVVGLGEGVFAAVNQQALAKSELGMERR